MGERSPDGTAFALWGPKDAPAVVLIHGLGLTHACWQWLVPELAARYRVLAFDLYGHGASVAAPETPTLAVFSQQAQAVMQHVGMDRAAVLGFSLGGMIARRIAQDVPAAVAALGALHSAHRRGAAAQAAIEARVVQAQSEGPAATVEAALERWFSDGFRAHNPAMMDLVRGWVMANDPAIYPQNYAVLANGVDEIIAPQPPIACPTLVMTGDEDYGNSPEMTHAIAAEIAGAEVHILPKLRHMAMAEDPAAFNAPICQFLERYL